MARLVAGIGSSHVPSIGRAYDQGRQQDPAWAPLFAGYAPVQRWLAEEVRADVAIVVYNDHGTEFQLDRYPTFALGVAEEYAVADEGYGPRPLPPFRGHVAFTDHLARCLLAEEFDLTLCQEMALDHGFLTAMPLLWPPRADHTWPVAVVPLFVNVIQHPMPSAARCFKLGRALRRAIDSHAEPLRVVVLGTGGLSHQLHGERFGHLNEVWDQWWMDALQRDPQALAALDHREIMLHAGAEGGEVVMWLVMRGALGASVEQVHRNYYAPMTTGMALLALREPSPSP
jgi:protocatechuate 4,5-dioxygenase beta chain